jgi:adenylate cyclase
VDGDEVKAGTAGPELADQVSRRLMRVGWVTNALGALIVAASIAFLILVFLDDADLDEFAALNAPLAVVAFVITGLAISARSGALYDDAVRWLVESREPNEREHRATLRLALRSVKIDAIGWTVGGVFLVILNGLVLSWELAAIAGATMWLGAETTCALQYLAMERALLPVTARALECRPVETAIGPGVRDRLAWAWLLGAGVPLLGVVVVGTVGVTKSGVEPEYVGAAVLFLGVVAYVVGTFATLFTAKAIADPLTSVRDGLERIRGGELDVHVPVDDGSEIGQLQAGFNRMADGLRERQRVRELFGRQVGEDVARAALRGGTRLGGEERLVGALYIDIVGSTSMALSMPPTEVVRILNRFFRLVVEVVEAEGGLVNKFEGDAALCVFGAPVPSDDPAGDALRTARALAATVSSDVREIDFGIGVSAGTAVAGNVGAEHRFEYTVIGDPVNEAARLSELAKQHGDRVLASDAALRKADPRERDAWDLKGSEVLRGRAAATGVAHPRALA